MNPALPPPPRSRQWVTVLALSAVIVLALVANNLHYIFRAQLYEQADFASNSIMVLQAKQLRAIHGNYSRWGFDHPGPAFFYCYAAGEALFYDWLRLVPTPFNGQVLAGLIVTAAFFAAAVGTAARWVGSRWFVPLTLLFGVLHFGALYNPELGAYPFLLVWPPCVLVIPFLCLLAAAASVGAGRGQDLPLLALAGGFVLHGHVAQPLFVLPICALAYAGLVRACRRDGGRWPWRETPGAHGLALGLAALFFLPIAIDLSQGSHSNFAAILQHMRTHRGERHAWIDALAYTLDFSAYRPYVPGNLQNYEGREGLTLPAIGAMLARHLKTTLLWSAALVVVLAGLLLHRRALAWTGLAGDAPAAAADGRRWRYARWLTAMLGLSGGLTLVWAHIMDGSMYFFNALFNFSIYFGLALLAALTLASALELVAARSPAAWPRRGALAIYALAAALFLLRPDRFRAHQFDTARARDFVRHVRTAIREDGLAPGDLRFLQFDPGAWDQAVTTALRLERDGYAFRVAAEFGYMFGTAHTVADPASALLADPRVSIWRINPLTPGPGSRQIPLDDRCGLDLRMPGLDPSADAVLFFDGAHHPAIRTATYDEKADANTYVCSGFSPPDETASYAVNEQAEALLFFAPAPVASGATVELTADLFPLCFRGRDRRRLQVVFNGQPLGDWSLAAPEKLHVQIPAALWNARPRTAVLQWRFPDAVAATTLGVPGDARPLAFGFRQLEFTVRQ